jgi:hypothetical protein
MTFEETRDNTTAIDANQSEADAHADTREEVFGRPVRPFRHDEDTARLHDEIVAKARQESEERNGFDDEPEDDGQPSEYEEWQDYFGGDDYYDHSENEMW